MNSKLNKKHTCLTAAALAVSLGLMGNSAIAAETGLVKVEAQPKSFQEKLRGRLGERFAEIETDERYIITFKDEMSSGEFQKYGRNRLAEGKLPICAEMCSTKALLAGDGDQVANIFRERIVARGFGSGAWGWGTAYSIKS